MKKILFAFVMCTMLISKQSNANSILNGDYSFLQEITFLLYDDNVPPYKIPVRLKTLEETLMFEVLHATYKDKKWVAYTMNKSLLGTYKVGQPAQLELGDIKRIYFVAGLPNSIGGLDLYVSEFKDGKWSKPSNLGKGVNTIYNESNPGLLNDHTLTYSSNGIIKKLDLNTLQVTDADDQPTPATVKTTTQETTTTTQTTVVKDKVEKAAEPIITDNKQNTVAKKEEVKTAVNNQTSNAKKDAETIAAIGDNSTATPASTNDASAIGDNATAAPVNSNAGTGSSQTQTKVSETYAYTKQDEAPKQTQNATVQKATTVTQNTTTTVTQTETINGNIQSFGSKTQAQMLATFGSAIQLGAFGNPNWSLLSQFSSIGKLVTYKNEKGLNVVWITGFASRAAADAALPQVHAKAGFQNAIAIGK